MNDYDKIAEFIVETKLDGLPPAVVEQVKRVVMDTVGCIIGGLSSPIAEKSIRFAQIYFGGQDASIIGTGLTANVFGAAFCNSYLANALDADDGHRIARGHPGGIIIPVAFAVAQKEGCCGSELIEAIVVGYETAIRCGMVANRKRDLYFGSAYWVSFGAAAAAAHLLKLEKKEVSNALGIVEMQSPSSLLMGWVKRDQVSMIKEGMGWGALTGAVSAYMAREGFTGTFNLFDDCSDKNILESIGKEYEILKLYLKPYAGCRWTHGAIDAVLYVKERHKVNSDEIREIVVRTFLEALNLKGQTPSTIEQAEYSIPYLVAIATIFGKIGPNELCSNLENAQVKQLAGKVRLVEDQQFSIKFPERTCTQLEVYLKDGRLISTPVMEPLGDYQNPISQEQLERKFRHFSKTLQSEQLDCFIDKINKINLFKNISEIINFEFIFD